MPRKANSETGNDPQTTVLDDATPGDPTPNVGGAEDSEVATPGQRQTKGGNKAAAKDAGTPNVGDIVLFVAGRDFHAGVNDPQIQAAIVAGVHQDGTLLLFVLQRSAGYQFRVHRGDGTQKNTWFPRA